MADIFCQDQETDRQMDAKDNCDKNVRFCHGVIFCAWHFVRSHVGSYYLLFQKSSTGDTPGNPLD
jgi:hypothetical protein